MWQQGRVQSPPGWRCQPGETVHLVSILGCFQGEKLHYVQLVCKWILVDDPIELFLRVMLGRAPIWFGPSGHQNRFFPWGHGWQSWRVSRAPGNPAPPGPGAFLTLKMHRNTEFSSFLPLGRRCLHFITDKTDVTYLWQTTYKTWLSVFIIMGNCDI